MAVDRIWESLKETAQRNAKRKRRLSREDSQRVIESICLTEGKLSLPRDAIEYFARELVRLTKEVTRK